MHSNHDGVLIRSQRRGKPALRRTHQQLPCWGSLLSKQETLLPPRGTAFRAAVSGRRCVRDPGFGSFKLLMSCLAKWTGTGIILSLLGAYEDGGRFVHGPRRRRGVLAFLRASGTALGSASSLRGTPLRAQRRIGA